MSDLDNTKTEREAHRPPLSLFHPLPALSRLALSGAVLSPVVVAGIVFAAGPAPTRPPLNHALGVSILIGLVAVVACLVLAVTDPALRNRRGRWTAAFLLTTTLAATVYLYAWQWRRNRTPAHTRTSTSTGRGAR